jgi:hypothetical protein
LSGDGIQQDFSSGTDFSELLVVIVSEYYFAEDDSQRISAQIRWDWSYVAADEDDDEVTYLSAALDIFDWEDHLNSGDAADATGFAAIII